MFDAYVQQAVAKWGPYYGVTIDPAVIQALIQAESSGGRRTVTQEPNGHHSYGPMMVLDTTALSFGVPDPSVLADPELGIWYGVRVFGQDLKALGGDVAAAISAYNTGPDRAYRDAAGNFPNQSYVNKVLGFLSQYGGALSGVAGAVVFAAALFLLARRRRAA